MEYHGVPVTVLEDDLSSDIYERLSGVERVAWDIETTGLEWKEDVICTSQLYDGDAAVIVRLSDDDPSNLISLLKDKSVEICFHHAMFDLRFMRHHWKAKPKNVACTKVAAKVLAPDRESHSLKDLLSDYLDIRLKKDKTLSDWSAESLSSSQIRYAVGDVAHLFDLLAEVESRLEAEALADLAHRCFEHIPTRVELEVRGYPDVFTY